MKHAPIIKLIKVDYSIDPNKTEGNLTNNKKSAIIELNTFFDTK